MAIHLIKYTQFLYNSSPESLIHKVVYTEHICTSIFGEISLTKSEYFTRFMLHRWYVEFVWKTYLDDKYNMMSISVTSDDNGSIFVCDTNHHCVRVFSTDSECISCLRKVEEY